MSGAQIILVMGVTGVGKSTFIQHAGGSYVEVGHGQSSCTAKVQCYQIAGTDVYLMDTPGFDDTHISDANILKEIGMALKDAFHDRAEIRGALYVHPVVEARMRGSGRKNLIMFRRVLGDVGMKNCRLVTTKWSLQDTRISEAREKELCEKEEFWKPLLSAGASTVRFGDSMESATDIIRPLVQGPAFEPFLLLELVRDNKPLSQTQAGQIVNDDIGEAYKAHRAEIADLMAQEEKAREARDLEFTELLRSEKEELEQKIKRLSEDQKVLDEPVSGFGTFSRWVAGAAAGIFLLAHPGLAPVATLLYRIAQDGQGKSTT